MKKRLKTHQFDLPPTHVESSSGTPEAKTKKRKLGELENVSQKFVIITTILNSKLDLYEHEYLFFSNKYFFSH